MSKESERYLEDEARDEAELMQYMVKKGDAKDLASAARQIEADAQPEDPVVTWLREFSEHAAEGEEAERLAKIIKGLSKDPARQKEAGELLINLGHGKAIAECLENFTPENEKIIEKLLAETPKEFKE